MAAAFFWLSAFFIVYCARPEDWIPGLSHLPLAKITGFGALLALLFALNKSKRGIRDLPVETRYLSRRFFNQPWGAIAWVIFIVGWLIPFSYLLKRLTGRPPERHQVFKVILFFGWIAIFFERMLLVFPALLRDNTMPIGPVEVLVTLGFFALFALSRNWFLARYRPVLNLPK